VLLLHFGFDFVGEHGVHVSGQGFRLLAKLVRQLSTDGFDQCILLLLDDRVFIHKDVTNQEIGKQCKDCDKDFEDHQSSAGSGSLPSASQARYSW